MQTNVVQKIHSYFFKIIYKYFFMYQSKSVQLITFYYSWQKTLHKCYLYTSGANAWLLDQIYKDRLFWETLNLLFLPELRVWNKSLFHDKE